MSATTVSGLTIAQPLYDFIVNEALPNTGINSDTFFTGLADILSELGPRNAAMLAHRDELQIKIDDWHKANPGPMDVATYKSFLKDIGYLQEPVGKFTVDVDRVDAEIASIAGPQLVVPVNNARYALNAANARWGSLYDALYGTDAISEADGAERAGAYNPVRGERVVAYANALLDDVAPLAQGTLANGSEIGLKNPQQCVGYTGSSDSPDGILLINNGLHLEIQIDSSHPIGKTSAAGIKDVLMEAALTTIQDCEDSVSAVDADDKVEVYRNWLGLMRGDLEERFSKGGKEIVRALNADRDYTGVAGQTYTVPGRSVLLVRKNG